MEARTYTVVAIGLILLLCSCRYGLSGSDTVGRSLEEPTAELEEQTKVIIGWAGYSQTPSAWYISIAGKGQVMTVTRRPDREDYGGEKIDVYDIQINRRFDFDGGQLLQFTSAMRLIGSDACSTLYHRFGSHVNHFGRNKDGILPDSAEAIDESGKLLGKATFKRYIKKSNGTAVGVGTALGFEVEEIHVSPDGEPYFRALSHYRFYTGLKVFEKREFGEKQQELFPVWPICN